MKKHILMVYPEMPTTYWGFEYVLEFIDKKASIPPLGLLTVAALLPEDYKVTLVDMNVSPLNREMIETSDMVFISAMIIQKRSFEEVVRLCKDCGKPVVAGGPYAICSHEKIRGVDHFVLDEAELTLPVFLEDFEAGCAKKLYRDAGKPDLKTTPLPRFDLIDVNDYDCMPLQYSRGCPYNCEFCDIIAMFGRKQRTKPPEQLIREMEVVYKTGFRGALFLVDDNFVGNKRVVKELLRKIVEWQREKAYPFSFLTEASIDLAQDDELLDLGHQSVEFGDVDADGFSRRQRVIQATVTRSSILRAAAPRLGVIRPAYFCWAKRIWEADRGRQKADEFALATY